MSFVTVIAIKGHCLVVTAESGCLRDCAVNEEGRVCIIGKLQEPNLVAFNHVINMKDATIDGEAIGKGLILTDDGGSVRVSNNPCTCTVVVGLNCVMGGLHYD